MDIESMFPEFADRSEAELDGLWKDADIAIDTNVLFHLYRYTSPARDHLLDLLGRLGQRLWIPHQVLYEYARSRSSVPRQQAEAYGEVKKILRKAAQDVKEQLDRYEPYKSLEIEQMKAEVTHLFDTLVGKVESAKKEHIGVMRSGVVHESLMKLLDGKVGQEYSQDQLESLYPDFDKRYSLLIPPGFADIARKPGRDRYGDAIIWYQLLEHGRDRKAPLMFVTDDSKSDWWDTREPDKHRPHPDLVREMRQRGTVAFYLYTVDDFMKAAERALGVPSVEEAIAEAKRVREQEQEVKERVTSAYVRVIERSVVPDVNIGSGIGALGQTTWYGVHDPVTATQAVPPLSYQAILSLSYLAVPSSYWPEAPTPGELARLQSQWPSPTPAWLNQAPPWGTSTPYVIQQAKELQSYGALTPPPPTRDRRGVPPPLPPDLASRDAPSEDEIPDEPDGGSQNASDDEDE